MLWGTLIKATLCGSSFAEMAERSKSGPWIAWKPRALPFPRRTETVTYGILPEPAQCVVRYRLISLCIPSTASSGMRRGALLRHGTKPERHSPSRLPRSDCAPGVQPFAQQNIGTLAPRKKRNHSQTVVPEPTGGPLSSIYLPALYHAPSSALLDLGSNLGSARKGRVTRHTSRQINQRPGTHTGQQAANGSPYPHSTITHTHTHTFPPFHNLTRT
jgi:hypothetical protein